jgi:hypothetical protein
MDLVITHLDSAGPPELKGKWKQGDVLIPPLSELPMAYLAKDQTQIFPADNMEDEHLMNLVLVVLYDYTADLHESEDIVKGVSGLYKLMEGRGADYKLDTTSLAYLIRLNNQIADKVWLGLGSPVQIQYGLGFGRRGPGIFSSEATMRFTLRSHLPRVDL